MKRILIILIIAKAFMGLGASAQDWSLKTNLLSDATANIGLGIEKGLAPKWTMDIAGSFNAWNITETKKWKHWMVQPGVRYWLCDRYAGHFFGAHLIGGQYNIGGVDFGLNFLGTDFGKLRDRRYQGWMAGVGVSYGYAFVLNKHWNIEPEIGFGYVYSRYDEFRCTGCGKKTRSDVPHNYVGFTKAAINVCYLF